MALAQEVEVLIPTLAALPLAVMTTECNGVVSWANAGLSDLTGYAVDEIVGQSAEILESKDATHPLHDIVHRVVACGEPWKGESVGRYKDGALYDIEQTITPIRDASGKTTHLLWTKLAVPDRGAVEELRRCKEELDILDRNSPIPYQSLNADGCIIAVNEAWLVALGYAREEIIGRWFGEFLAPDQADLFRERFPLFKEHGWVRDVEFRMVKKDGSYIHVAFDGNVGRDRNGRFRQTHCVWRDISEHKRAEDAIHQAEANLSALIESTEDLLWSVDLTYALQVCNKAFRDNIECNYGIRAAVGMECEDLLTPERATLWPPLYERALSEGPFRAEYSLLDGRMLELSFNPIRRDGRITGISVFGKDITERKVAEQKLREAESKYRNIYEGALEGVYRTALDGRALAANPAFARMLGYGSGEEVVTAITDAARQVWFDPDEHSQCLRLLEDHGVVRGYECRLKRKDGGVIWVSLSVREVIGEDGRVLYNEGFVEDIAARKTAEQERRHSDKRYKSLFDSMNEGVALHKLLRSGGTPENYILLEVNRRSEEILGVKRDQVADRLATEVYGTKDAPYLTEYASVVQTGTPVRFETYFPPMDKHFVISVVPLEDDLFATIFFDVTEQKRTQERYKLISENAADVIWLWDLTEGRCVYVSPSVRHLRGFTPEELLAQSMDDAMPSDAYRMVLAETQNRIAAVKSGDEGARTRTNEVTYLRKDGTTVDTETVTKLLSDESGTVRHVLGISRDITERKRAQEEKAKLENDLRQAQKLESVGRLAGGVAHDFNNLLTVINGYSDLVLKRLKTPDPLRSYVEEIKTAGERAASLTKQLLAFSRKQVIQPVTLDLNATIRDSVPMLQRVIGEDIVLETHLDNSLGQVIADPNHIHQIMMNLFVNARDAMPEGGKLEITTRNVDLDEASAACHADAIPGQYLLMTVTDTGQGMDETVRQQIFEPFFTTKESGKGTGLGLATVYGIIKQSDGWIDVWSEVGVGTSFMIYLPRTDGRPLVEENGIGAAPEGGGETILLVEDQEAVRSLAKAALKQHGYQVIEASDGEEAIAVAEGYSGEIQLLLTDVVMTGMNGKELSERLLALRPSLKVLFVSGYTANVIAPGGVLDHGIAYMPKPFSPDGLAAKVRKVLSDPAKPAVGT
jgi:PAS domain S-box-containing protein